MQSTIFSNMIYGHGYSKDLLEKIIKGIEPSLADPVERTVIEYSDRSLTSHYYGYERLKKHLKHCNYDSAIKFELAGVGIDTVILLFRDKN